MSDVCWDAFVRLVNEHERFVLTSHIRPDCDALGSELGLAAALQALGKSVRIVNGQATPAIYRFIDPRGQIQVLGHDVSPEQLADAQVLIVLDTSAWVQLGSMADVVRRTPAKVAVIDHHVSEDDLQAELFKDPTAEATGRLVVEAIEALGVPLTEQMATPLLAAIATDTGWFRFNSVTSRTYRVAAQLIDAGASPTQLYRELYERDSLARVRLRGLVLHRIETELDGRLAYTYVMQEDFQRLGATPSDTEDLINQVLQVDGTEVAVIFVQQAEQRFKLSFRSRSDVDCSTIAERFGGGGHKAAAGAIVEGRWQQVRSQVLDAVRRAMT